MVGGCLFSYRLLEQYPLFSEIEYLLGYQEHLNVHQFQKKVVEYISSYGKTLNLINSCLSDFQVIKNYIKKLLLQKIFKLNLCIHQPR